VARGTRFSIEGNKRGQDLHGGKSLKGAHGMTYQRFTQLEKVKTNGGQWRVHNHQGNTCQEGNPYSVEKSSGV